MQQLSPIIASPIQHRIVLEKEYKYDWFRSGVPYKFNNLTINSSNILEFREYIITVIYHKYSYLNHFEYTNYDLKTYTI